MAGIKFSIHPLFYLLGVYYAFTGKIFIFIICTLIALIHELGHSFTAERLGYRLDKIVLMPFGAIVTGNIKGLNAREQIRVALSGPLINLALSIGFYALWWLFPLTYTVTSEIVSVSNDMLLMNLLPVFPLDGGRVLMAILSLYMSEEKAGKVCKGVSIAFSVAVILIFVLGLTKGVVNISLISFGLFVASSLFTTDKNLKYVRFSFSVSEESLKRGMAVKRQAISVNTTVKRLIEIIEPTYFNEITVYNGLNTVKTLTQKEIDLIVTKADLYGKIGDYI